MKSVFKPVLSGVCLLGIAAYSYAEETVVFDDMTVTATRSAKSSLDLPVSIGRKSGDEVELDKSATQKELLNSIAGVRINQTGSTLGHMASIRLPTSTNPYYLYLQDSIPVQSSGFFNHNALAFTNFSDAGSVEVMKGAGTALYGSDAIGATINVRSPSIMDQLGPKFSAEVGSDDFRRYTASGGVEIDQRSAISASVSHADGDGWRDHSEYDRQEFSVNYVNDFNYDNSFKVGLNVNSTEAEMTSSINDFRRYRDRPEDAGDSVTDAIAEGVDPIRKFDHARLSVEWNHIASDTVEFNTIAYVRHNRNRYNATWEQDSLPFNDTKENSAGLLLKADMDLSFARVITGLDIEYTEQRREYTQQFDTMTVPAGKILDYEVDYTAIAPYTRLEFQLTDQLTLGAGLRYDYNSFEYTNKTDDGVYATSTFARANSDRDPSFNHLSPKLDLTYQIDNKQTTYARYANGYRVPQATRLYQLHEQTVDFTLDEETTDTYEVGYKLKTQRNEFAAALYYLVIQDTIVERRAGSFPNQTRFSVNGGRTLHKGIELSLASVLTDELTSKIAYSFSQHEFDDDEQNGDNEQREAPENVANARLIYTPNAVAGLTAMVEWEHVGSYWLDDANTTRYSGHDVANIKMRYQLNDQLALFGRVTNLTDRLYAETANITFGPSQRYTPAAPRQAFVGMEYKL